MSRNLIEFRESDHKYFNTDTGEEYISCTTLLGLFKPEFKSDFLAECVARKRKLTKEQVLQEWSDIAKKSTDYGTLIHAGIEGYIKNDRTLIDEKYDKICSDGYDKIISFLGKRGLQSEKLIYNHIYKIAGQSDIVQFTNGFKNTIDVTHTINILDIKTNKEIEFYSKYDEYLKYPLNHLQNCNYNIYSLQLSLYAYMLQSMYNGFNIGTMAIVHYNKENTTWNIIHCPYMLYEVRALLKVYKQINDKN